MDWDTIRWMWPSLVGAAGAVWVWWTRRGGEQVTREEARARGAEVSVNTAHTVVHMLSEQLDDTNARLAAVQNQLDDLRREFDAERLREQRRFHGVQRQLTALRQWAHDVIDRWDELRLSADPPSLPLPVIRPDQES